MADFMNTWCYECKKPVGMKRKCSNCWRYFHAKCHAKTDAERLTELECWRKNRPSTVPKKDDNDDDEGGPLEHFKCFPCTLKQRGLDRVSETPISKEEINYLLRFAAARSIGWDQNSSFCDVSLVQKRLDQQDYEVFEGLLIDLLDLAYKTAIEYGGEISVANSSF